MHRIVIPQIGAATAWRDAAREMLNAGVPPEAVDWGGADMPRGLFDTSQQVHPVHQAKVPRSFIAMANTVVWHSDADRFARLYAFLWRLRSAPELMVDRGDADLAHLRRLEKNVRRCQHKMKAFVRFREIGEVGAPRRSFAAWFEPTHHTVEPTADFFVRRFADMDWRILTPDVSAVFENGKLRFEQGRAKPELPADASEALWITYFRNIFNPARLMVSAMQSEMPKKYWKNMPEAAEIPDLIANAPRRALEMQAAMPTVPSLRTEKVQGQLAEHASVWDGPAQGLGAAIEACTRCPLHRTATQAVPGEGPLDAELMIVGEQPGDQEDLQGRPFVGPAGQLFDQVAQEAGLDRAQAYVTNAVKHFKFQPRGRRRIHQRPDAGEVQHCKWWLEAEQRQVQPKLILAMGATAALALTGSGDAIMKRRGTVEYTTDGTPVLITYHPSYLLRVPDADHKTQVTAQFKSDLALALRLVTEQSTTHGVQG
ncbi:MAG: UdgX family uracil-DNA binding protein [Roseovarius sp.]